MPAFNNLTGQRFGRLEVIERAPRRGTMVTMWRCRCDCGNEREVYARNLRNGNSKSCGCGMIEAARRKGRNLKHGLTGSRTHNAWRAAKERCTNPRNKKFADYGGRGVQMCDRWAADFRHFLADMGQAEGRQELDRIDAKGNYEPGNCRWASRKEQMANTRMSITVSHEGRRINLTDFAALVGVPYNTLLSRVHHRGLRGLDVVEADALLSGGRR